MFVKFGTKMYDIFSFKFVINKNNHYFTKSDANYSVTVKAKSK